RLGGRAPRQPRPGHAARAAGAAPRHRLHGRRARPAVALHRRECRGLLDRRRHPDRAPPLLGARAAVRDPRGDVRAGRLDPLGQRAPLSRMAPLVRLLRGRRARRVRPADEPRGHRRAGADGYLPWDAAPQQWWTWTNNYSYSAVARLADGMSLTETLERLNAVQAAIADEHFRGTEWSAVSLEAVLIPLHEWVTGGSRQGLLMLLAGVFAALLVACLNIANLMLARGTGRTREAGIRGALGASRVAIFRGALIESGLLGAAGAAGGVIVALAGLEVFASIAGAGLPRAKAVELDGSALALIALLAAGSTVAFGLLP